MIKNKKKRTCYFFAICGLVIIVVLLIIRMNNHNVKVEFKQIFGLKLPSQAQCVQLYYSYGSHHDGERLYEFLLSQKAGEVIASKIKNQWEIFPLPAKIKALGLGVSLPKVSEGYWCYVDRGAEGTKGYSSHISLAIYDSANYVMYFYELDT